MINFLLIGDKNFNIQLVNSINSLVENYDLENKDSHIYIIHKNPRSFKKYLKYLKTKKIFLIKFNSKFKIDNNLKNSHVTEVTYYRLYLDKLLDLKQGILVYFDADLYFLNNINNYLNNEIENFKNSDFKIAAVKETINKSEGNNYLTKLGLDPNNYFNAGFIIFNLQKCLESNFFIEIRNIFKNIDFKLKFWDQDLLNLAINGKFYNLDEKINFGIILKKNNKNIVPLDNLAVHYKGKNKPWDKDFVNHEDSNIYQKINFKNFNKIHKKNKWKFNL